MLEKEFIEAIQENQKIIFKVCNLYADRPSDREDLFQEILFNAWKGVKNFKAEAKFSTWLYRVALNTSITYFKKQQKNNLVPGDSEHLYAAPSEELDEQSMAMNKAIEDLSTIDKALVMLYLDDYSYPEIAEIMGISVNNISVKMNRIKARLKEGSKKYL